MKKLLNVLLCNAFREPPPNDPLLPQSQHQQQHTSPQRPAVADPQVFFRLNTLFKVQLRMQAQYLCEQLSNCFLLVIGSNLEIEERSPLSLPRIDYQPQICMLLQKLAKDDKDRLTTINNANRCKMMRNFIREAETFHLDLATVVDDKVHRLNLRLDNVQGNLERLRSLRE